MYDTRHTYATMCLMAGMNTAFMAEQPRCSVQVLLSINAWWINSPNHCAELDTLKILESGTNVV